MFTSALNIPSFMSLRNHLAVLDSPRPGRIMNFGLLFLFHSPSTAPLSFGLISSVSGYVKFLSKGKHIGRLIRKLGDFADAAE